MTDCSAEGMKRQKTGDAKTSEGEVFNLLYINITFNKTKCACSVLNYKHGNY